MSPKTTPSAASARRFVERGRWLGGVPSRALLGAVAVAGLMGMDDQCRPVFPAHRRAAYSCGAGEVRKATNRSTNWAKFASFRCATAFGAARRQPGALAGQI